MEPALIAILIVVVLAGIFIVLTMYNRRIAEPPGCEEIRNEACGACKIADKCKITKEDN